MKIFLLLFPVIFGCFTLCLAQNDTENLNAGLIPKDSLTPKWLHTIDLDGDKIYDSITFDYTGGVHCCYLINIVLSSDAIERKFPFEMDGGYIWGVDNSLPEQFDIRDIDHDGLPEILMKIQTYNLKPYPVPKKWKRLYDISSNYIVIEYKNGQLITRDYSARPK